MDKMSDAKESYEDVFCYKMKTIVYYIHENINTQ